MSQIPSHIVARRAQQRARRQRCRLLSVGAALACALAVVAVVALSGGTGTARRVAAPRTEPRSSAPGHSARAAARHRARHASASTVSPAFASYTRLLRLDRPIFCGGPHGHEMALTFDDGPGVYTHYALKKLNDHHQHATFFDVGKSINAWPGWIRRETHLAAIEDHTYTHPALIALSPATILYELRATKQLIEAQTHQKVLLFRPPYELYNSTVEAIAHHLGLLTVLWSVDSQDSLGANSAQIIANVDAGLRPGAIIELHENHGQTIRALTTILPQLAQRHLRAVSVPQLLADDPPSTAQVLRGGLGCGGTRSVARAGSGA